jgi:small subunit ribosomal protein S7
MQKSKIEIKTKIINHLLKNGEKKTSENALLKSFKELQKQSSKNSKKLAQLAIIYSLPIFKLHKITQKKKRKKQVREIPAFILKEKARISLAIKFILASTKKKTSSNLYIQLKEEILSNSQNKGDAIKVKDELQKQVSLKKRFFRYYRWHS